MIEESRAVTDATLASRLNKGLEGIAYNRFDDAVWMVSESWPRRIWRLSTSERDNYAKSRLECNGAERLGDWAGLAAVPGGNHVVLLSEESRRLVELDVRCNMVDSLSLDGQASRLIPQPEGVAFDDRCQLHLISEPNLMFRFSAGPGCN